MFGKSKEPSYSTETKTKIGTIIGEGAVFDGNLSAPDSMRIDGTINGNCRCEKELIIGTSGAVEGNISVQNIIISGKVTGDIFANGKLELLSTGKIAGNICAKSLVIDENASFDGRCTMTTSVPQNALESSPASSETSSNKSDSDETDSSSESASAEDPPSRKFVRIPTESVNSEAEQSEPAPARQRSRAAKPAAQQAPPQ
ncbi:MAG: polymer-forming cytoskeletal protein [Lachnospiraceae bacterium]|nr:polymer-forming cytoskeletal protein [Lachnospiraceae bacterium]